MATNANWSNTYTAHDWTTGDTITETLMDNIEIGIQNADNKITDLSNDIGAQYASGTTYQTGDYCMHLGELYRCTNDVNSTPGTSNSGWAKTNIMAEAGGGINNSIATTFDVTQTYNVGDYVVYQKGLYRCTTAITSAGAWTGNINWTSVILANDITNLRNNIIQTQATQPTDIDNKVWVDTSNEQEYSIPLIDDTTTSAADVWSSQKVENELNGVISTFGAETTDLASQIDLSVKKVTTDKVIETEFPVAQLTAGRTKPDGTTATASSTAYTPKIAVESGDIITCYGYYISTAGAQVKASKNVRAVCAYNGNTVVSDKGTDTSSASYTVPDGITDIVVTIANYNNTYANNVVVRTQPNGQIDYYRQQETFHAPLRFQGSLAANTFQPIGELVCVDNYVLSAISSVDNSFSSLKIGGTDIAQTQIIRPYIEITPTQIKMYSNTAASFDKAESHGLTIADDLQIMIISEKDSLNSKVIVQSGGSKWENTEDWRFGVSYNGFGMISESAISNIQASISVRDLNKPIWVCGDSWVTLYDTRWYGQAMNLHLVDFLRSGHSGEGSVDGLTHLKTLLSMYTPKMIVWLYGMNDADTDNNTPNAKWLAALNELKTICENRSIELVLATIPTTPTRNNNAKNAVVAASGYRYVNEVSAMGADTSGNWITGYQSDDGNHTTESGARALLAQVFADVPEIVKDGSSAYFVNNINDLKTKTNTLETETGNLKTTVDNLIIVSDTQPVSQDNEIWIPKTNGSEVEVPDMAEFNDLKSAVNEYFVDTIGYINKNLFTSSLTYNGRSVFTKNCTVVMDGDDFILTPTAANPQFGGTLTAGTDVNPNLPYGYPIPCRGLSTLHFIISNDIFNRNYVTFFDENNVSLGFTNYIAVSDFTVAVMTDAEYAILRIGSNKTTVDSEYRFNVKCYDDANYTSTISNQVSDLKDALDLLKRVPYQLSSGYISNNGSIVSPGAETKEVYTNEIPFDYGDSLSLVISLSEIKSMWCAYVLFDENHTFIARTNLISSQELDYYEGTITNTVSNARYIAISYRTYDIATMEIYSNNTLEILRKEIPQTNLVHFENPIVKGVNHRGYTSAPENTLPAFRLSRKMGFLYVETDVEFTAPDNDNPNGVPVLLHDSTINRTARNADGTALTETVSIHDITYAQALDYDFGIYKGAEYAGTKIPTLEEFFLLCRGLGLLPYVELKDGTEYTQAQVEAVVDLAKKYGMKDRVTWISFNADYLTFVKNYDSKARLGFVCESPGDNQIAQIIALRSGENEVFADCHYSSINSTGAGKCIRNDIPLEAWTLNSKADLATLNPYVTGITTDSLDVAQALYWQSM